MQVELIQVSELPHFFRGVGMGEGRWWRSERIGDGRVAVMVPGDRSTLELRFKATDAVWCVTVGTQHLGNDNDLLLAEPKPSEPPPGPKKVRRVREQLSMFGSQTPVAKEQLALFGQ